MFDRLKGHKKFVSVFFFDSNSFIFDFDQKIFSRKLAEYLNFSTLCELECII
jgi:hypothetical protein